MCAGRSSFKSIPRDCEISEAIYEPIARENSTGIKRFASHVRSSIRSTLIDPSAWGLLFRTRVASNSFRRWFNKRSNIMLSWALTFLVIALNAAALGFSGLAGEASWVAHVLFVVFLILFLVSAIMGRRVPP